MKPGTAGTSFKLHFGGQSINIVLPLPGEHNVRNACAAAAVCLSIGIDAQVIRDGLESVEAASGRLTRLEAVGGALLFDDSYNANPASVDAASDFIAAGDGESILVLGDMRELGSNAEELHRQAGRHAKAAGVSQLVGTGELTRHAVEGFGEGAHWLPNVEAIVEFLRPRLRKGQRLLVKGSRSMHMGRVVRALQSDSATDAGTV